MNFHKFVEYFISSSYQSLIYHYFKLVEKVKYGDCRFSYNEKLKGKRVYVLANGPSLKDELIDLDKDSDFMDSPKFVVNGFASSQAYTRLRPDNYCVADPAFFLPGDYNEKHKRMLRDINEKTGWEMTLYVPINGYNAIKNRITNNNITVIPIPTLEYRGFNGPKYKHYKKGIATPSYVNVTIMIEYILLNLGCKDIRLYGVDHTFTEGLVVDVDNHLCIRDKHFYGNEFRRIIDWNGRSWTTAEYLYDKYLTFKEHENMRGYADYLDAQIVNCTKISLIDAYIRLAQLEKENNQDNQ